MKNSSLVPLRNALVLSASLGGLGFAGCGVKQAAPSDIPGVTVAEIARQEAALDAELLGRARTREGADDDQVTPDPTGGYHAHG